MRQYLLIVTEDGFGKRVAVDEVRRTSRGAKGVNLSSAPVAAVLVVDRDDGDVVIATAAGRVERVAVRSFPVRRRSNPKTGHISRGGAGYHAPGGGRDRFRCAR